MNGREMSRQSAKQTNAQTQARQPNKPDGRKCRQTLAAQVAKAVLAATATTPKATSMKKRLNIQPKNIARI